jgi:hypothetical protein
MIPILVGIAAALAAGALVAGIIYLARLTLKNVKEWFGEKKALTAGDKHKVEATFAKKLADKDYIVVQLIFDSKGGEIVAGRKIKAEKLDEELEPKHKRKAVVLYNY